MDNGLYIKSLTMRNMLSVGNNTQTINFEDGNIRIVTGEDLSAGKVKRSGIGKAQPLYSKVKVPTGWIPIGKLRIGDKISAPNGTETVVTGVYPQGLKTVNKIKLEDGRLTEACNEHLWKVRVDTQNNWRIINTSEISKLLKTGSTVVIPLVDSVYNTTAMGTEHIDGYQLGMVYSIGKIVDKGIFLTTSDSDVIDSIIANFDRHPLKLLDNGVLVLKNSSDQYLALMKYLQGDFELDRTFVSQTTEELRKGLIQAIFDVYGYDAGDYVACDFPSVLKHAAYFVQQLVFSLGGKCKIRSNIQGQNSAGVDKIYTCHSMFKKNNVYFTVLKKKVYSEQEATIRITSVEPSTKQECVCISILDTDKLYITDSYIVTHNTTIPNILCYALYGKTIVNMKKSHVINNINAKDGYCRVDFSKYGIEYFIERGIKPDLFRFGKIVDGDEEPITQGTKSDTQGDINKLLGIGYDLFIMIVTINAEKEPYMRMTLSKQRDIIEELLSISELSRKAKILSDYKIKNMKTEIEKEHIRIEAQTQAQKRSQQNLDYSLNQLKSWDDSRDRRLISEYQKLDKFQSIDIDKEIEDHQYNKEIEKLIQEQKVLLLESKSTKSLIDQGTKRLNEINSLIESYSKNVCPTCKQSIANGNHQHDESKLLSEAEEYFTVLDEAATKYNEQLQASSKYDTNLSFRQVQYRTIDEAYNFQRSLDAIKNTIDSIEKEVNPHIDSVENAKKNLLDGEVDYSRLEEMERILKHMVYLQKILTGRDSFVRKRIIDTSIPVLNQQIASYLDKTEMTHEVRFESDLTFEVKDRGIDYSYDNLSRGERNWTIIALSLAMRDLFEQLTCPINILFIDELIDFGIDQSSAMDAFKIIKTYAKDRDKSVSLITHREELFEKADGILFTTKENGFTTYEDRPN